MTWTLHPAIDLRNDRVPESDADRQQATAAEILRRLNDQPGLVLADEVGMGKTYVALATAVSVLESTKRRRPVVVMVPPAVVDKWPVEWDVFEKRCLPPGHGLRASAPVRRGSEFLKLFDDPPERARHLIFVTHGALTLSLQDPFIRLALIRRAMQRRPDLESKRVPVARYAAKILNDKRFDEATTRALLDSPLRQWRRQWERSRQHQPLEDDPVPTSLAEALPRLNLDQLRAALLDLPSYQTVTFGRRMAAAKRGIGQALDATWLQALGHLNEHLPLLIVDEAHHLKNANRLAGLFRSREAQGALEAFQGPLAGMFERMLFLTATPFQLGHGELLNVLRRFTGVRWTSPADRTAFEDSLEGLRSALDRAQQSALSLEQAWDRIDPTLVSQVEQLTALEPRADSPPTLSCALGLARQVRSDYRTAEQLLRPWVIRHVRPDKSTRRKYFAGRGIVDNQVSEIGLAIDGAVTLPFLLAARAQAVDSLGLSRGAARRSLFAYGLASSFEAYADTRRNRQAALDDDADVGGNTIDDKTSPELGWYLDRIDGLLPDESAEHWAAHPKVRATVARVRELWTSGEKVLVFCFYVETGRALRAHISRALRQDIVDSGARALHLDPTDDSSVITALERVGERLLRTDSAGSAAFQRRVAELAADVDEGARDDIADVVTRFMRTPSFLVRFTDLSPDLTIDGLIAALDHTDGSGDSMHDKIKRFAEGYQRRVDSERSDLLAAMKNIQTGNISMRAEDLDPSERSTRREALLPNVRLANGGIRRETRRRLMLAFNTPPFPRYWWPVPSWLKALTCIRTVGTSSITTSTGTRARSSSVLAGLIASAQRPTLFAVLWWSTSPTSPARTTRRCTAS